MKRFGLLIAAAACLAGCGGGSSGGKDACGTGDPCGIGSYCAHTPDGNVCWKDGTKPVISAADVSCSDTPCRRDSVLHVTATVTDESAMGRVAAILDVDVEHPWTLEPASGSDYTVDIPLADVPFPYFEHAVSVTVKASDEAENSADGPAGEPTPVTRARWTKTLKGTTALSLSSPAILPDGRIVLAGSDGKLYFVSKDGTNASSVQIGTQALSGSPVVSDTSVWVGSEDGKLYSASHTGVPGAVCNAADPLLDTPAVVGGRAVASTKNSYVVVADAAGLCVPTDLAASTQPAVSATGRVVLVSGGKLRTFTVRTNGALHDEWTGTPASPDVGSTLAAPSIGVADTVWTTSQAGGVLRTTTVAEAQSIATASANSTASVLLSDGSAIVAQPSAVLVRARPGGGQPWSASATLSGQATIPLVLGGATPALLVPTSNGRVFAVGTSDGQVIWSQKLSATNQSLEPANIWTEPGAPTSTAYLAGADGNLYAVIVDGALDTSAPWPKAFHDPQNTSNAGVTP